MQKIITATGKEFAIAWCGVSTIDFVLRFAITETTMEVVLATFLNREELKKLIHVFDDQQIAYTGYDAFKGVDLKPDGSIVVSLMRNR